jgi:predicted CoA-binding protein
MTDIETLQRVLSGCKTVAVVGLSDKPHRPSYFVGKYLLDHGYEVIPVNPTRTEILGCTSYPTLADVPVPIDMVDCFRRSELMPALAEEAVAVKARVLWMQLGVTSAAAKELAEASGLTVVMDRCTKIEHARLFGGLNWAGVNTGIISSRRPRKINL